MTDFNAWEALPSAMQSDGVRRSINRNTVRRVAQFAKPHTVDVGALVEARGPSTTSACPFGSVVDPFGR